nr:MAG TPA: 4Fe-4S binding domain protein [Caudoviricetes sp.]
MRPSASDAAPVSDQGRRLISDRCHACGGCTTT